MAWQRWAVVFVVALLGCSSTHTSSDPAGAPSSATTKDPGKTTTAGSEPVPALAWRSCDAGDCATLSVPRDYGAPSAAKIRIAVARASTAKPGQKIGSLLVNPGGPGASGVDIVGYIASGLPTAITDRFDIVAWDPRGSGGSSPVKCGEKLDYLFTVDAAPDDRAELDALEAAAHRFVDDCVAGSGDLLRHLSTVETTRDLDRLRAALGDQKLTYLGLSYGTSIGGLYATMFPEHVRALVLDGAVDPQVPTADVAIEQAQGFGASLQAFFAWCSSDSDCRFHHDGDPRSSFTALTRQIDAQPIARDGEVFGPTNLDIAVVALLYGGSSGYRLLADGLHDLERGSTGSLTIAFDEYMGRTGSTYDSEWAAFIAISCADGPNLRLADAEAVQRRAAIEAPEFGAGNVGLGYQCSFWPYPPARTGPTALSAPTAPPIVVVGTTGDPATPLTWAQGLARQLQSGRLVTVTGTTHTASLNGNGCLDAILTRYLVDLEAPESGRRCG